MYFITTFGLRQNGSIDHKRTVGFYDKLKDALRIVEDNVYHISETIYDYAVIEQLYCGTYPDFNPKRYWFKFNRFNNKYDLLEDLPFGMIDDYKHITIAEIG